MGWADKKRDDFLMIKILTPFQVHLCSLHLVGFCFFLLLLSYNLLAICGQICVLEQQKPRFACNLWALDIEICL